MTEKTTAMATEFRVVPLTQTNGALLTDFSCGAEPLDRWLRTSAKSDDARSACRVHVCEAEVGVPVAFFTLSSASVEAAGLSRSMQGGMSGSVPATLLGKMGVRLDLHGNGYGSRVLEAAKEHAREAARISASRLFVVDVLVADLIPWYELRGFVRLPGSERRLVFKL